MRRGDSHLVFDVDLAKSQTEDNPVFYVQMAHARLSGIFRVAERAPESTSSAGANLAALGEPEELLLMQELAGFPSLVAGAAAARAPPRATGLLEGRARPAPRGWHNYRAARLAREDAAPG